MGCCDELERSCEGTGASVCSSSKHAHGKLNYSCEDASPQYSRRSLPSYAVWRARQLASRDLLFGTFLMLITLIYLYRTAPKLCDEAVYARLLGVRCTHMQREHECLEVCQQPEQPPVLVWRLVCRYFGDPVQQHSLIQNTSCSDVGECPVPSAGAAAAAAGLVTTSTSLRLALRELVRCSRSAMRKVVRAIVMFFIAGALSGDPFHITMPLLRLSLLLLLLVPLPYPNMGAVWHTATAGVRRQPGNISWVRWYYPRHYWQFPNFRLLVVVVQRVITALAAFACVGFRYSAYFESSMKIMYWQGLSKYVFQGWLGWMLVLPFRLHLLVSAVEWAFFYALGVQIERLYRGKEGFFDLYHLVTSLVTIVILPTLGVWWLERSQKFRYQQLASLTGSSTGTMAPTAAQYDVAAVPLQHNVLNSHSSCSNNHASTCHRNGKISDSLSRKHSTSSSSRDSSSGHMCNISSQSSAVDQQLYSSVVDGLRLLEAQKQQQQHAASPQLDAAAAAAILTETADSSTWPAVPSILASVGPALRSVLADEAAEVFAAAAACAAAAGGAAVGGIPSYTSMAKCLPASVKVHTSHSNVSLLEPLLTSCLASQVSQVSTSPAYMHTACFAGCVQLLANVLVVGSTDSGSDHSSAGGGDSGGSAFAAAAGQRAAASAGNGGAAAALLTAVSDAMRAQGGGAGLSQTQGKRSGSAATSAAAQPQAPCRTDSANTDIEVVFGNTAASTAHKGAGSSSGEAVPSVAGVQLLYCEPACVVAGVSQQLTLHLRLPGGAQGDGVWEHSSAARLLVFYDGVLLVDQEVVVAEHVSVTVMAPESPGIINIALLPCANTAAGGADAATHILIGAQDQDSPAAAAAVSGPAVPLLLTPLLVLPEQSAQEVQHYWQQAADSAVMDDSSSSMTSCTWQSSVLPLTVDMAYVLAAGSTAPAAASKNTPEGGVMITDELRSVLKHLLLHLAGCGMFHTMHVVVTTVAAAVQQGPAASNSVERAGGSSSSSSGDVMERCPANFGRESISRTASCSAPAAPKFSEIEPAVGDAVGICKPDKPCSNRSSAMQLHSSSMADSTRTVAASELLWGFRDPAMESRYQAATFSATSMLDCACAVYNLVLALSCYPSWAQRHKGDYGMLHLPDKQSSAVLMFSRLLVIVVVAAGPVGVLLVRLRVAGQLQVLTQRRQQQREQQQQQQVAGEENAKCRTPQKASCSSSSSSKSSMIHAAGVTAVSHQQQQQQQQQQQLQDAEQTSAILASAARKKQWLQLYWLVAINVWGVFVLLGSQFIAPPVPILRVWASSRWAADVGITASVALRGWVSQVPLAWHLPLIVTELAENATGSWMVGVHPPYWPVVRFLMCVILPVVVATWQHWQGRRRFCVTCGIQVVR